MKGTFSSSSDKKIVVWSRMVAIRIERVDEYEIYFKVESTELVSGFYVDHVNQWDGS